MSQAEELLNSLEDDYVLNYSTDEPHIVINPDRTITVPNELKTIAVQYDNNVETVTFDCPRYWDEHDFSTMNIFINYMRSDGVKGNYAVTEIDIDANDDSIIHFNWTISEDVTLKSGTLSFLVCIKNNKADIKPHWNSRLNQELIVAPGMEIYDHVVEHSPEIVEEMLTRLDTLETAEVLSLVDQVTGVKYTLYVADGNLLMKESEG